MITWFTRAKGGQTQINKRASSIDRLLSSKGDRKREEVRLGCQPEGLRQLGHMESLVSLQPTSAFEPFFFQGCLYHSYSRRGGETLRYSGGPFPSSLFQALQGVLTTEKHRLSLRVNLTASQRPWGSRALGDLASLLPGRGS